MNEKSLHIPAYVYKGLIKIIMKGDRLTCRISI